MNSYPFNLLTEYFVRENHIDTSKDYEIVSVPARSLICPNRFDLMAKWIYIDALERGGGIEFATSVYKDNINAFSCGSFTEYGTESKNSFQKYLESFNGVIQDIKNDGFDPGKSLVPVGANDVICDGAHRVTAAAYYNKSVTIIRFPELTRRYNYGYFRRFLMSDTSMGYMAMTYSKIMPDCYMACLWPKAGRKRISDVTDLISGYGDIIYSQDVYLTYQGICNFMTHCYGHQAWTGNIDNHFSGIKACATGCYDSRYPVRTYLFSCKNFNHVLHLKQEIRSMFGLGNHSVHIGDNSAETLMMTRLLYNPNSVQILNNAKMFKYAMVFKKVNELKNLIVSNHKEIDRFIIDSSSVLEVCGLRQARDVDFLTDYSDKSLSDDTGNIDNHDSQLPFHSISVRDMLYNPENYFYFNGMKFLSIKRLIEMKQKRGERKDKKDVKMLRFFQKRFDCIPLRYRYSTQKKINEQLIRYRLYGYGGMEYGQLKKNLLKNSFVLHLCFFKYPYSLFKRARHLFTKGAIVAIMR